MPNHVQNRVIMTGDQTRINELLRTVQNDEEGPGTIDFNKIIPMPKDLEIECGSRSEHGFKAYADFISIYLLGQKDGKIDVFSVPESSEKAFLKARTDIDPETWALGKQSYHNVIKYGYANWYDWSIDNWGMKTDWFTDIVRAKWAELNKTDALKTTLKKVFADCKDLENDLGDDAWKIDMARNIYTFVAGRIKWLDKQWL